MPWMKIQRNSEGKMHEELSWVKKSIKRFLQESYPGARGPPSPERWSQGPSQAPGSIVQCLASWLERSRHLGIKSFSKSVKLCRRVEYLVRFPAAFNSCEGTSSSNLITVFRKMLKKKISSQEDPLYFDTSAMLSMSDDQIVCDRDWDRNVTAGLPKKKKKARKKRNGLTVVFYSRAFLIAFSHDPFYLFMYLDHLTLHKLP